jgi:hypothetical protein
MYALDAYVILQEDYGVFSSSNFFYFVCCVLVFNHRCCILTGVTINMCWIVFRFLGREFVKDRERTGTSKWTAAVSYFVQMHSHYFLFFFRRWIMHTRRNFPCVQRFYVCDEGQPKVVHFTCHCRPINLNKSGLHVKTMWYFEFYIIYF